VLYNIITRRRLEPPQPGDRHQARGRWRRWALAAPFALFPLLYFLPWNVIYAAIAAMIAGAIAGVVPSRPEAQYAGVRHVVPRYLYDLSGFAFGLVWTGKYEHFTSKRGASFA
jgi:hypothetical protein